MLRIPHCLDNRLGEGGKVVSPKPSWIKLVCMQLHKVKALIVSEHSEFKTAKSMSGRRYRYHDTHICLLHSIPLPPPPASFILKMVTTNLHLNVGTAPIYNMAKP
jgi:hypothetical protein